MQSIWQHETQQRSRPGTLCRWLGLSLCLWVLAACEQQTPMQIATIEAQHTNFPLEGAHKRVTCESCHVDGHFADMDSSCTTCHTTDFNESQVAIHEQVGTHFDCALCHTIDTWTDSTFDHSGTDFDLNGAHQTAACLDCHADAQTNNRASFANQARACVDCHIDDFNATSNPDHIASGFQTNCTDCHSEVAWAPANFDHNRFFVLNGAHVDISCTECHSGGVYAGTPTDCWGCHQDDFAAALAPVHSEPSFAQNCLECHTEIAWTPSSFDHNTTNFALNGAHIETDCASCHTDGLYLGTPTDCWSCHQDDYAAATDPDHFAQGFPTDCLDCHTEIAWTPADFDHSQFDFALNGAHQTVKCAECHIDEVYAGTPSDCWSCHNDDFAAALAPVHSEPSFAQNCLECHTEIAWTPSSFDHNTTNFALNGAHIETDCAACHVDGLYLGTPTDCIDCHQDDYDGVVEPDHAEQQFPTDCLDCHTEFAWLPADFDHDQFGFSLNGAHVDVSCAECHIDGVYAGTPRDCWSCHNDDFAAATAPVHVEPDFSRDCLQCHRETGWQPSFFDHGTTGFQLNGAHITTDCVACHEGGVYVGTPTNCIDCHQDDYDGVSEPDHVASGFPTDCLECHTELAWTPSAFDHSQFDFALNGAHQTVRCAECHVGGVYEGTPSDCWSCHNDDFAAAVSPVHTEPSFAQDCLECHTEAAWMPSFFDHNTTNFALNGAHIATDCAACHVDGVYVGTPTDCWSCHQADYEGVVEPNHVAQNYPTDCLECHTELAWTPSSFDHSQFDFALNGAHQLVSCAECHVGGVYDGTPSDCWSCHSDDYAAATSPVHTEPSFSQNCLECHTEIAWQSSFFDHNTTDFALNGAHIATDCVSCHAGGVYAGTPTDCISCHADDEPRNHFGPDCAACHNETAWEPAFDHDDVFPITRGEHSIYRQDCGACHLEQPATYSTFSCIDCHDGEHQRNDMDDEHRGINGYRYESTACLECHPDGDS